MRSVPSKAKVFSCPVTRNVYDLASFCLQTHILTFLSTNTYSAFAQHSAVAFVFGALRLAHALGLATLGPCS